MESKWPILLWKGTGVFNKGIAPMKRKSETSTHGGNTKKQNIRDEPGSIKGRVALALDKTKPTKKKESAVSKVCTVKKESTKSKVSHHSFFSGHSRSKSDGFSKSGTSSLIADCFSSILSIRPFGCTNLRLPINARFDIYSLSTLKTLLTEKKKNKEIPDLRFLIDLNKKVWFARESHKHIPAPAHYQMTGESQRKAYCITAGNLVLTDDYKTLFKINHKSGDFRPFFDSLKWFIALLILNEKKLPFLLPSILHIEELNGSGMPIRTLMWNIADLRKWVKNVFTDDLIVSELLEQEQEIQKVIYKSRFRERRLTLPSSLEFTLDLPDHKENPRSFSI